MSSLPLTLVIVLFIAASLTINHALLSGLGGNISCLTVSVVAMGGETTPDHITCRRDGATVKLHFSFFLVIARLMAAMGVSDFLPSEFRQTDLAFTVSHCQMKTCHVLLRVRGLFSRKKCNFKHLKVIPCLELFVPYTIAPEEM